MLVPLEWRLIAYNFKSICPKSSTLDKCRAPCQFQNTIMFSATGIYILTLCNAHWKSWGGEDGKNNSHLLPLKVDWRDLEKKSRVSCGQCICCRE